ncbi:MULTISPECIES: anti-sigma factor [Cryobacterium]|uniref:Regulator of SigK n=1 Tax=Cryobacterium breve TaxID=1259258 RepID=A0ABY2JA00_9MICO|nr:MULTISPECIES: anti-sigma factor [Cryobacterium]TFC96258.1 anti-sigma factor [Cryobacterium sp. TmT3-12]TFD00737.1 anti-sigma factor [Cryobacterium breve]
MSDNTRNDDARTVSGDNPGELAGAYALNALGVEDAAAYEAHLAVSEQARIEAAELSDTAVALGLAAAPVRPSAGLKVSLMAKLASTTQLAPLTAPATTRPAEHTTPAAAQTVPSETPGPTQAVVTDAPALPSAAAAPTRGAAAERARVRWFQRPVGVLAAAAAAVALFAGGTFVGQSLESGQFEQDQAAGLVQITAAADTQRASARTTDGQEATLVWSEQSGLSALLIDDLPALSAEQDYQLWYIGGSGPVPAGTFDSSGTGTVWRVLDGSLTAGDTIGVTVEPKGGSKQPTSDPILAIQSS